MEVERNKIKKKHTVELFTADTKITIDWNALSKTALPPGLGTAGSYWYLSMGALLSPPGCNNCRSLLYIVDGKLLV